MPTHEATTRLYRKLVDVLGQENADTLFADAKGREPLDFPSVDGADDGTS